MTTKNDLEARLMPISIHAAAAAANDQLTCCHLSSTKPSCLRILGAARPWRHKLQPCAFLEARVGRDAAHRTRNLPTHPTHGCITLFCGFDEMLIASRPDERPRANAIAPFFAIAISIAIGAGR